MHWFSRLSRLFRRRRESMSHLAVIAQTTLFNIVFITLLFTSVSVPENIDLSTHSLLLCIAAAEYLPVSLLLFFLLLSQRNLLQYLKKQSCCAK